jgi:hypothetical protein
VAQGINHDEGKTKWELLPYDALEYVAQVLTQACTRKDFPYPKRNWEKGMDWSKAFASAQRHARDFAAGERLDHETGLPVAAHAAFRWLQILAYQLRGVGLDDMKLEHNVPERCMSQHVWQPGDRARVGSHYGIILSRSHLEPDKWVFRRNGETSVSYVPEKDLIVPLDP